MNSILRSVAHRTLPLPVRLAIASRVGLAQWYRLDNHITFKEAGFAAAPSPALLLARHHYEVATIRELLTSLTVKRALEIGCGYGRLSPIIAEHAEKLIAVDVNPHALEMARRCYPHIEYQMASASRLPFDDSAFDLIVSWTVLQHVPPDQFAQVTAEVQRVLAPGGVLILCEETRHSNDPSPAVAHTWHRSVNAYTTAFAPLQLQNEGWIDALEAVPELLSPGRVMVLTNPYTP